MHTIYLLLPLLPFALFFFLKAKTIFSKRNLIKRPPGPWTLPLIGSLHHLIGFSLPHHALHDLSRRYGDLMFLQIGEQPTVVISSKEAARQILKFHETIFCNRPAGPTAKIFTYGGIDLVFAPYGEYWRELRKILTSELLGYKRVQSFKPIREEEVSKLIQSISSLSSQRKIVNLSEMMSLMSNKVLVRAATANKSKGDIRFSSEIERSGELSAGVCLANLFPSSRLANLISTRALRKAAKCHMSIDELTDRMIQEHRASHEVDGGGDDLLSVLLRLHEEDGNKSISMDTVKAIIFDAVAGGTDEPGALLHWAMSELVKNPKVMKKAQDEVRRVLGCREIITEADLVELNYIRLIIKETLRLHPLTPLIPRLCQDTVNILDYEIAKGTTMLVNLWNIGVYF
ncbi:cytochrome P450 family 71 polypeptide [Rhynchospora pubera]|uniref:Cytochrome P450 family 71 polypeptide n=1 Tax=Rhynchospora pubera TaxID=906938 RepID=A0AAV8HG21_9POAL|nr:cytochrome P450 family 71 polypeptide [Rhynchospora pubera]